MELNAGGAPVFCFQLRMPMAAAVVFSCVLVLGCDPLGGLEVSEASDGSPRTTSVDAQVPDEPNDSAVPPDASEVIDAGARDSGAINGDSGIRDAGNIDSGPGGSVASCRPIPLPCLDASPENVIEIPTEASGEAFMEAPPGSTIQVRGLNLGAIWWIPSGVTLRGCEGAEIRGNVGFSGNSGTIEGFTVTTGTIFANRTGTYFIRDNHFAATESTNDGLSLHSRDGLVSAHVTAYVERNLFEDRPQGIGISVRYDTMIHRVTALLRNNIFARVDTAIVATESGLVGEVNLNVEHNTFLVFGTGVFLSGFDAVPSLFGNLFVDGSAAVEGTSVFQSAYNVAADVGTLHAVTPIGSPFVEGTVSFEDAAAGDYRPVAHSHGIDMISSSDVHEDFYGCVRPSLGSTMADVGAIER